MIGPAEAQALAQALPPPTDAVGWLPYIERAGAMIALLSLFGNYVLWKVLWQQIEGRSADRKFFADKIDGIRVEQIADGKAALLVLDKSASAAIAQTRSGPHAGS